MPGPLAIGIPQPGIPIGGLIIPPGGPIPGVIPTPLPGPYNPYGAYWPPIGVI